MIALDFDLLPPLRSPKVRGHARGQRCTLRFPGVCSRDPEKTVCCHIRDRHKGGAQKSSDSSIVFGCSDCHVYLDESKWKADMDEAAMLKIVIRAMQETLEILIWGGILKWPTDPWRNR